MTPQDLTQNGVNALIQEINALSPSDKQQQVAAMQNDFKTFITTNFNLTQDQSAYISGMSAAWFQYAGYITGVAIANNLNITLTMDPPPQSKQLKLVHSICNTTCTNQDGEAVFTGGVTFHVEYSAN